MSSSSSGAVVSVALNIPGELVQVLKDNPEVLGPVAAAQQAAGSAQQKNNLKQIALAMHNYHDVHRTFPPAYQADASGKPLLSWRVLILPYLEQDALYREFHLR